MKLQKLDQRWLAAMAALLAAVGTYLLISPSEHAGHGGAEDAAERASAARSHVGGGPNPGTGSGVARDSGGHSMDAQWREWSLRDGVDPTAVEAFAASSQVPKEVTIDLDPAAQVPAAVVKTHAKIALSDRQERLKAKITNEFLKEVKGAEKDPVAWEKARATADARFRILFGESALQRQSVHAERVARALD